MQRIKPRFAVINALFISALLAGCPAGKSPATISTVKVPGGAGKGNGPNVGTPAQPTTPGNTPDLPTGTPEGPTPLTPPADTGNSGSSKGLSFLGGSVFAPASIISNNGGAIISNNGGAIISNNGGAIISNNGGAIISNNGGAIISNSGGNYRVLDASGPEGVLKNAFLYLTDRDERFFRNAKTSAVFTATTDTAGAYNFNIVDGDNFPINKDVIVNALLNGNLRMTGYIVPADGENSLKLNLATTLTAEYLRGDAYRNGKSLKSYNRDLFYQTTALTQSAITAGDIAAVKTATNHDGSTLKVGTFDLRIDHVFNLRNQYVIAISAVNKANAAIKKISDNWKTLLGARPTAVTTFAGTGDFAKVNPAWNGDFSAAIGGITGDWRNDSAHKPATETPLGFNYDVAVAQRGDVFICGYSESARSGFVRWIKPSGEVSSVWLPTYDVYQPAAICIENEPTDPPAAPGTLLLVDNATQRVIRIPIVDVPQVDAGSGYEVYGMEYVAGEDVPFFSEYTEYEHPYYVDCKRDGSNNPVDADGNPIAAYDSYNDAYKKVWAFQAPASGPYVNTPTEVAAFSRWRLSDEGQRTYQAGNTASDGTQYPDAISAGTSFKAGDPVNNPARFAQLNRPQDVEIDELGNIYIADKGNHRIRMIPKVAGNYFGYRTPLDDGSNGGVAGDGVIDGYGGLATMQPGCIYTIAGNPTWNGTPTGGGTHDKTSNIGGYWFGEFADSDASTAGAAQVAKLDQPYSLAFDRTKRVLYVTDHDNQRIRALSRESFGGHQAGAIWTAAGAPTGGQRGSLDRDYAPANLSGSATGGDGGAATAAQLSFPRGITVDAAGRLYIADGVSGRIRMVDTNGTITTIAGRKHDPMDPTPTDNVTDGDALLWADLYDTEGLAVDNDNNLLLADVRHRRVRKLWRQWD